MYCNKRQLVEKLSSNFVYFRADIRRTLDIFEHSIECERTCRDWRWLYTPSIPSCKIVQMMHFFIILSTDVSVVFIRIQRKCIASTLSFICLKFYIDADLTDLRKNSNNLYRFFWQNRDYIERFSTDCRATVVGVILDKQLSEQNGTFVLSKTE